MYIKHLTSPMVKRCNKQWLSLYNEYYDFDNRVVKIFKIKSRHMYMEDLSNGITLDKIKKIRSLPLATKRFIFNEVIQIYSNQFNFKHTSIRDDQVFIHSDFWLKNLMYVNDRVILIDADSFGILNINDEYLRFTKFVDSFLGLQYRMFGS